MVSACEDKAKGVMSKAVRVQLMNRYEAERKKLDGKTHRNIKIRNAINKEIGKKRLRSSGPGGVWWDTIK